MDNMDEELENISTIRNTFIDENDNDNDNEALDLDLNTVKNLIESVSQEYGIAGPASTLLTKIYK